ncbi:MAG: hypothetical protein DI537_43320 [Stutzerimonas stutzeri]|nr:MAG: hypothetical protein DI537_43320 [Stutzerimonas stutzeri]
MTKHPGTTVAERRVLDAIGGGDSCPPMTARTRDAMLRKGLIHKVGERELGRDRFGVVALPIYEMPIPIHMQWCSAVAAEEPDGV